jgi:predicted AlkP superfamily pyrophosphatase or phosphodiesterase
MTTRIHRTWRLFGAFIFGLLQLAGCGHLGSDPASRADLAAITAARPALVVLLVIDGLPMRQVTGYRHQLAPDGFARFLSRGAWYSDAHYGHAFTVTAAGHSTLLTGAYPHRTGIIGNEWRDPVTGERVYNTGDATAQYIGHKTQTLDGTSPRRLKAESLGDVLKRADARSRVIAISGKDRGAILPAGWSGTAYMYMGETGEFASSTYYMAEHPAWVKAFNAAKPAARYFKTDWKMALPEADYAHSLPDDQPWYGPKGGKLPMRFGAEGDAAPTAPFYASLLRSPFGDALALDFARAAIAGEQLGQDDAPDILSISLSGHDYVNHAFSAESRLSHDHLIQLDRLLQDFFQHLDKTVGEGRYVAVLTADHGFSPAPEYSQQRGPLAARFFRQQPADRQDGRGRARAGPGRRGRRSAPPAAGRTRRVDGLHPTRADVRQPHRRAVLRRDAAGLAPRCVGRGAVCAQTRLDVRQHRRHARLAPRGRHARADPAVRPRMGDAGRARRARRAGGHRADAGAPAAPAVAGGE